VQQYKIEVHRPFLEAYLTYGGESVSDAVAYSGKEMTVRVKWQNNLQEPINDASIKVSLGGTALNKAGIKPDLSGFYRSVDDTLIWDYKTTPNKLKTLSPGASGEFSFKIRPLSLQKLQNIDKPELTFAVHTAGKRSRESNVPESLVSESTYVTKVATDILFDAYALYNSGKFGAIGPMPPKVDQKTQYNIVWRISNSTSDVKDAVVRAELPNYVEWINLTSPANELLVYNKVNHAVEWDLGNVDMSTGFNGVPPREVSFAVNLIPSLSQLGTSPDLVYKQIFSGVDTYTGAEIIERGPIVDTKLNREPGFNSVDASVVK
jgi:hypothetical protein